jgi:pimeloyl-ACP methyl ester carboxylesterase
MTIVLVHGNPETEAVWDDLVPHLRDPDVVRLAPPGFGSAIPAGFDCSVDAYRDWLAGELGKFAQPVDLVGHDWGGGHVVRIAMEHPDLIRSWTTASRRSRRWQARRSRQGCSGTRAWA